MLSFDYAPNKQKILDSVLEHFLDDVPLEDAFYEFSNVSYLFKSGTPLNASIQITDLFVLV